MADRFQRQAKWQKNRVGLPWPVKISMAARMRDDIVALGRSGKTRLKVAAAPIKRSG